MKYRYIFSSLFCLSFLNVSAQFVYDYLKAADSYFAKNDYASAAGYYEKYLGNGPVKAAENKTYSPYKPQSIQGKKEMSLSSKEKALWQLAESYRQLHHTVKAAEAYQQLIDVYSNKFPLAPFFLAEQLRALQQYADAEVVLTRFLANYTLDDSIRNTAVREKENLRFIQMELSKPGIQNYRVEAASGLLKSTGADYAPVWVDSVTMLFTSTRAATLPGNTLSHSNRLYLAQLNAGDTGWVKEAGLPQPDKVQQGVASLSANAGVIYLTRWNATGEKNASVYTSMLENGNWITPIPVAGSVNQKGYSSQQPFVTRDGKFLLFSSNQPGGYGGFDIWYAPIDENGKAGVPVNAGASINTSGDEQAPFFDDNTKIFVFASNGRIGMGGFDLFYSKGVIGALGEPVNMGYPVNSVKDDIYFAAGSWSPDVAAELWLSSDRNDVCCLELFKITRTLPANPVPVTPAVPQEPLVSATPPVVSPSADTIVSEVIANLYYAYGKAEILKESEASLDKLVDMLRRHESMVIEIGGHTDAMGSPEFNQQLSLARAINCVKYITGKGISGDRVMAKGYGASKPVAPNANADGSDNPEGRKLNRRTEFTILKK